MYQNLDARLPDIVASAELIVGAQHRLDVRKRVALGQERLDGLREIRRTPEAAANHHFESGLALFIPMHPQRHVMDAQRRAIVMRGADGDLEFARHEGKFGMQGHVLADELGPDTRILDLVGGDASPLIGGDIADVVAAGLHAVHADAGQLRHRVRQFGELDPMKLNVLPGGEMTVAAIVLARDLGQLAQL